MKLNTIRALPTIYRQGTRKDHILYWRAEYRTFPAAVRSCSGVVGMKEKVGVWTDIQGTNVGKSNEKTPAEQAEATAKQHRDDRIRHGYHVDITEIGVSKYFSPMLAHTYDKDSPPEYVGATVQPKLNGERAPSNRLELRSRRGHLVVSCPHIAKATEGFFKKFPEARLDGELYNHELREHLNRLRKLTSRKTPTAAELSESAGMVQYHIYDGYLDEASALHPQRFDALVRQLIKFIPHQSGPIRLVDTYGVRSEEEVEQRYRQFLKEGYEGLMIRTPGAYEAGKRSKTLLKYKPRYDSEYTVISGEEGKGKRKGMLAKVHCVTDTGVKFKANVKWKDEEKKRLWSLRNKLPGKKATVSYAYLTEYGVPFHNYLEAIHGI